VAGSPEIGESPLIRNVVLGRLREAADPAQQAADAALLQEGLAGIAALRLPGMLAMNVGSAQEVAGSLVRRGR